MDASVKTYRNEGIKGFYKGLLPGFFGVSHTAIQLMMYEEMKIYYKERHNMSADSRMVRYSHRFLNSPMLSAAHLQTKKKTVKEKL